MKCNSCQENISPKMRKAVENNICPFCGDKIVPDELRKSLTELDSVLGFLLEKFEKETFDYLKDRYGISNRPVGNTVARKISKPRDEYDDDSDSDDESELPEDLDDTDLPLKEKLKDKNYRKKYIAAGKITGNPYINHAAMADDEPRGHTRQENDDYVNEGNQVDSALHRKLLAMSEAKNSGKDRKSDKEKLEDMIEKSRRSFSPPS